MTSVIYSMVLCVWPLGCSRCFNTPVWNVLEQDAFTITQEEALQKLPLAWRPRASGCATSPGRHSGAWRSPAWPPPPAVQSTSHLRPAWGGSSSAPLTPGVFKERWPRGLQTRRSGSGRFPRAAPAGCRAPVVTVRGAGLHREDRTERGGRGQGKNPLPSLSLNKIRPEDRRISGKWEGGCAGVSRVFSTRVPPGLTR